MSVEAQPIVTAERETRIERIAADLLPRASQLTRLIIRRTGGEISRADGGILRTLSAGPRRITELAELEGLAQPTMTALVKRLEERGWVARHRHAGDGRVALISLTAAGAEALESFRAQYRSALAQRLASMSEDELRDLDAATAVLGRFVCDLQAPGGSG